MILNKQLVEFNGELYWVYRKVKVEQVKDATLLKDFWRCDIALKQQEWIWFCRHIPEAVIES
jgi:hypothetical protein